MVPRLGIVYLWGGVGHGGVCHLRGAWGGEGRGGDRRVRRESWERLPSRFGGEGGVLWQRRSLGLLEVPGGDGGPAVVVHSHGRHRGHGAVGDGRVGESGHLSQRASSATVTRSLCGGCPRPLAGNRVVREGGVRRDTGKGGVRRDTREGGVRRDTREGGVRRDTGEGVDRVVASVQCEVRSVLQLGEILQLLIRVIVTSTSLVG